MKKCLKIILIIFNVLIIIFLMFYFFFPVQYGNLIKIGGTFFLNMTHTDKKNFEIIKGYGMSLEFPKTNWIYYFHNADDIFMAQVTSVLPYKYDCSENSKCCIESLNIDIFKNKKNFKKIKNFLVYECKNKSIKSIEINGKKFLMMCIKSDKEISSVHLIPEDLDMIFTYYFNSYCGFDLDRLKRVLKMVKFKNLL